MTTTSAITISCLQTFVTSGNSTYPIFVGFASAQDIRRIAEAPSFRTSTPHDTIAKNTLTPPIRDWQRPIDQARVNEISNLFNTPGEFMPNPVLLCQNVNLSQSPITIQQQLSNPNGMPTGIWNVVVPILSDGFPLWIIDGQHRIAGLAQSQQAANPIPVVLLLNQESAVYTGPTVAKLFAQVTTSATKLDPLHNEWLTFAFALGNYSQSNSVDIAILV